MTFDEFVANAQQYYLAHKEHLRKGQAYMNYLHEVNEDLYHAVPWDVDPFYQDKYLHVFLDFIQTRWGKYY